MRKGESARNQEEGQIQMKQTVHKASGFPFSFLRLSSGASTAREKTRTNMYRMPKEVNFSDQNQSIDPDCRETHHQQH